MDPAGAAEQDDELDALLKLREKVGKIPVRDLKVGDLPAILDVLGWGKRNYDGDASSDHIDRVEKIVKAHNKRR
jgi:hypothetical protein